MGHMTKSTVLMVLRVFSALTALLSILQALRGFGWIPLDWSWHGHLANITFVTALVAAIFGWLLSKRTGGAAKGLFMHAAGMAVLAVVQIGLGEMGLRSVHMAVGVFFLVGAIALATLSFRTPVEAADSPRVDHA